MTGAARRGGQIRGVALAAGLLACARPGAEEHAGTPEAAAQVKSTARDEGATREVGAAEVTPVPAGAPGERSREVLAVGVVGAAMPAELPAGLRWLAIGGGATPEFNQVSIEQDLLLAQEVFGTGAFLLFAGGAGSHGVQVEDPAPRGDPLLAQLAELFAPRGGRGATYRPTVLAPVAAATVDNALAVFLKGALAEPGPPLLVYLAGHGERGEVPRAGGLSLWGQELLRVQDLSEVFEGARRPAQIVATSCFSGAFAELVFARAEEAAGAAQEVHCGLFAATAEREASGCDPNPDRAAQEGFALHFLNGLRGQDRAGARLALEELDVDGDGQVSPLEAHARARIAGLGIDVPTTTSERWLRATAPARGRSLAVTLPEEEAVIAGLGAALGYAGREEQAARDLEHVLMDMSERYGRVDEAVADEDAAYRATAAELLARFPVLDDPWHPDFAATIAGHRDEIAGVLATSEVYARFRAAQQEVAAAQQEVAEMLARSARLERLVRALDNRALAGRLKARGGAAWERFEALRACERTAWPRAGREP